MKTKDLILSGLFAAMLCISSVIIIPIGTIPVTLSVFAIALISTTLPAKCAFFSIVVYIFAGLLGLPVFAGFNSGFSALIGPSGGYIWSYLFFPLIAGKRKQAASKATIMLRLSLAMALMYIMATVQFVIVQSVTFYQAALVCVLPFIIFDIAKIFLATIISDRLQKIA